MGAGALQSLRSGALAGQAPGRVRSWAVV